MTSSTALYLLAWLDDLGERGWSEAPESATNHVVLVRGDERIGYTYRFNGGDSMWFPGRTPRRLRDRLPGPFREGG